MYSRTCTPAHNRERIYRVYTLYSTLVATMYTSLPSSTKSPRFVRVCVRSVECPLLMADRPNTEKRRHIVRARSGNAQMEVECCHKSRSLTHLAASASVRVCVSYVEHLASRALCERAHIHHHRVWCRLYTCILSLPIRPSHEPERMANCMYFI